MGRRRCCCFGACVLLDDHFDDVAASSTLDPARWTEERGDWEYDGTTFLEENGTVDASVLTVAETRTNEQVVGTLIAAPVPGRKYRLIYNAVDEANYHFVEWEVAVPDVIRWYKRTGGSNSLLRSELMESGGPEATDVSFSVCSNSISSTVEFSPSPPGQLYYLCNPSLFANGKKAGLGNGTAAFIKFDHFSLGDYLGDNGADPITNRCCLQQCQCTENGNDFCIPHVLVATLVATGGCEAPFDGDTWDMIFYPPQGGWESYDSNTLHDTGDTPADLGAHDAHPFCGDGNWWLLSCAESPCGGPFPSGKNFSMTNELGAAGCIGFGDCETYRKAELSFSCNPTVITFPIETYAAFDPAPGCPCCDDQVDGTLQVIITEP